MICWMCGNDEASAGMDICAHCELAEIEARRADEEEQAYAEYMDQMYNEMMADASD